MEGKDKEQLKIAINGTKHSVRTTDNRILHQKLISTPPNFQRSPKKDLSLNNNNWEGPVENTWVSSEKPQKVEERIPAASKQKVQKVESDKEDSDNKSASKPVHVDIDKDITERGPTLA